MWETIKSLLGFGSKQEDPAPTEPKEILPYINGSTSSFERDYQLEAPAAPQGIVPAWPASSTADPYIRTLPSEVHAAEAAVPQISVGTTRPSTICEVPSVNAGSHPAVSAPASIQSQSPAVARVYESLGYSEPSQAGPIETSGYVQTANNPATPRSWPVTPSDSLTSTRVKIPPELQDATDAKKNEILSQYNTPGGVGSGQQDNQAPTRDQVAQVIALLERLVAQRDTTDADSKSSNNDWIDQLLKKIETLGTVVA